MKKLSPMMTHYFKIKEGYKDCIILYRLGDFYEMFFEDAVIASEILQITLTGRDCGLEERAPMCGVPYHSVDNYIKKLVDNGKKVAICEQLNTPEEAQGKMVTRDVVRIITPGTVTNENQLKDGENNYIACVFCDKNNNASLSWIDVTTGEFNTVEFLGGLVDSLFQDLILALQPSEIICNNLALHSSLSLECCKQNRLPKFQNYYDWAFGFETAKKRLTKHFKVLNLETFEIEDKKEVISSAGGLIEYIYETQKRSLIHINSIKLINTAKFLFIDRNTRRNLELYETMRDKKTVGSLFWLLNKTKTNMGSRLMRRCFDHPMKDEFEINARLDAVEELTSNSNLQLNLSQSLCGIKDVERLVGKLAYNTINPVECINLGKTVELIPKLKSVLNVAKSPLLTATNQKISALIELSTFILSAIDEKAPTLLKDGGYIKTGFNAELDELRQLQKSAKIFLANIEAKEREGTGIKGLKLGYNKIFGYYFEVSNSYIDKVPFYFVRKQTIAGGERFITDDLKEFEHKILTAYDKAVKLEQEIYNQIKLKMQEFIVELKNSANGIALIDVINSFAEISIKNRYCKPKINNNICDLKINNGRHPIVEEIIGLSDFVGNDSYINTTDSRTLIISGPNMAGKSTYMRQIALIVFMAHLGCFVPATDAEIPITDRIFTRVGAGDDVASGISTFMLEMIEVATILNCATENSLLILDEIGRGTSTCDGLSIAFAVVEYINSTIKAKTLFATHYHELTELEDNYDGIKNYKVLVKEYNDTIIFLHKIARGGANKSFGIEVASLAGLPNAVVGRAKEINKNLSKININKNLLNIENVKQNIGVMANKSKSANFEKNESSKFCAEKAIVDMLLDINLNNTSPIQSLTILEDIILKAKNLKVGAEYEN